MRVLFTFRPHDRLMQYFADRLDDACELIVPTHEEEESLLDLVEGAEVVVGWRASDRLVAAARDVVLWQNPGVGVTHLIDHFRAHPHVTLANCHGNTYFTAQHAVAMLLTLTNAVHRHHAWMKEGRWRTRDEEAKSTPLRDRNIGLLGYGSVGRRVAKFLSGFDVEMTAFKSRPRSRDSSVAGVTCLYSSEGADLISYLASCDILIVTLPLTRETEGMVGERELQALGPGGLVVNVGRGQVIVEEDLFNALRDGTIAGAALDVWPREADPREFDDGGVRPFNLPFHQLDNVVMSPHRAASPFDDLGRWDDIIENVRRAAEGRTDFLNVVDLDRGY